MKKQKLFLLTFLFSAFIFSGLRKLQAAETNDPKMEFLDFGLKLFNQIRNEPHKLKTEKVTNKINPSQIDEIEEYDFRGIQIQIYRVNSVPPRELINWVKVTRPAFQFPYTLKMGSRKGEIEKTLGVPTLSKKDSLLYEIETFQIEFLFSKNKLTKVCWFDNGG